MVFWVGEDRFVYYPAPGDPLRYELPRSLRDQLNVAAIRPGIIYTDGGSVPKAVQAWAGLSPWGYGPAYIVHDWLFAAHHCIVHQREDALDPSDHEEVETVRRVDFQISADVLAGVIQALVDQNAVPKRDAAPAAIYTAVDSGIAKRLWDSRDPGSCKQPDKEEIAKVRRALGQGLRIAKAPGETPGDAAVLVFTQRF